MNEYLHVAHVYYNLCQNVTITRIITLAYNRARARAHIRQKERERERPIRADIRYEGERRAGRGYRDVPVGRCTGEVKERKMDLVQLEI